MNATAARLEVLAAAVRAIAEALPPDLARRAALGLQDHASRLPSVASAPDADAAMAGELAGLLAALARVPAKVPSCYSPDYLPSHC